MTTLGLIQSSSNHNLLWLLLLALVVWLAVYAVYKFAWRRDYGLPVRRRLLLRGIHVHRDQVAFVPFWWSDLQIQRAVKNYWRETLHQSFAPRVATKA